jgi:hypothetical protein
MPFCPYCGGTRQQYTITRVTEDREEVTLFDTYICLVCDSVWKGRVRPRTEPDRRGTPDLTDGAPPAGGAHGRQR